MHTYQHENFFKSQLSSYGDMEWSYQKTKSKLRKLNLKSYLNYCESL